jgi:PKD repeat protein
VAALMLQADPAATPAQIKAALGSSAIDMLGDGFDYDSGHGLIQADAALAALSTPGNVSPTAGFSIAPITSLEMQFNDTSTDTDGTIATRLWDFGDGGESNIQSPTYTFSGTGTYNVTLTATDNEGATDAVSQDVTVSDGTTNTAPEASFSYTCNRKVCEFSGLSSDPDAGDDITARIWNYGDRESSTEQNPTHTYTIQGNYTVILEVMDTNSSTWMVSASVRVKNRGSTSGTVGGTDGGGDTGVTLEAERGKKKCGDGIDIDGDGDIDGADADCSR